MKNLKSLSKSLLILLAFSPSFVFSQVKTDSLIGVLPTIEDYTDKADLLHKIGWSVMYSYPDSALAFYTEALNLGVDHEDDTVIAKSYNRIGIVYDITGEWDKSLENYGWALEKATAIQDTITMASTHTNKGLIYWNKNELEKALLEFLDAQSLFESIYNKQGTANCLHNIALIHMDLLNEEKSIEYHKKALALRMEVGLKSGIIDSKTNLALLYIGTDQIELADQYLNEGIAYYESVEQFYALSKVYSSKGQVNRHRGLLDSAVYYYKQSIKVAHQIGAKNFEASSLYSLGDVYYDFKKPHLQIKTLLEAEKLAIEKENGKMLFLVNDALGKAYNTIGQYKKSSDRMIESQYLRDSIYALEKQEAIANLELKYETAKKENQINKQELLISEQKEELSQVEIEKVNAELAATKMRSWIFLLIAAILIIVGISYFLMARNKKKLSDEKNAALLEEKENSLKAVVESEDNERKRIAKNLHDSVIQQLVSLKFGINAVDIENKSELLELLDTSTFELRDLSHQLMPKGLVKLGLEKAIEDLLKTSLKHTEIKYQYEFSNIEKRAPEAIELNLYRVVQELTHNLVKHSNASRLDVQLYQIQENLHLVFEDNGVGFDVSESNTGVGMRSINSRVEAMEGSVNMESNEGKGTLITIKIPLA